MSLLRLFRGERRAYAALLVVFLLSASVIVLCTARSVHAQSQFTNLVSYRVTGAPNYTAPGTETFWSAIPWTDVPLAASVAPGGGHTPDLLVKSANDGFNIYMLFRWNDSVGPSYDAATEMYESSNGTLLTLNPANTANVTRLFYNSTYYYPDRVAMLWFVGTSATRQQSPAMMLGSDGAITGGAANIWHWQSNPTDNDSNDTGFPGGYTNPMGTPIFPDNNESFAEDDYTNTTGFFVIGGSFGAGSPNLDPYADPFIIHAGNYFSADKTWTVEMVRSFTTSDSSYRVQLATGSTYYVAFAVWNGRLGESSHLKSVSQWYTLTISGQTLATQQVVVPATEAGISPILAAAVGLGLLIVGMVVGIAVRQKPEKKEE